MPGAPPGQDALEVFLEGPNRLGHRGKERFAFDLVSDVVQEIGRTPPRGLAGLGSANPAKLLLDAISDTCGEGTCSQQAAFRTAFFRLKAMALRRNSSSTLARPRYLAR